MNLRGLLFILPAVFVACGGNVTEDSPSGGAPAETTREGNPRTSMAVTSCSTSTFSACAPAVHVSTPDALMAIAKKVDYQTVSVTTGSVLVVGSNITADEDIEVTSSDLTPAACPNKSVGSLPPCHDPLFSWPAFAKANRVAGVSCLEEGDGVRMDVGCVRLKIAKGTTFRLRGLLVDQHPWELFPMMELFESCEQPCAAGQVRCGATNLCMSPWENCMYCEGKSSSYCACLGDDCQMKAPNTVCHYSTSPDTSAAGMCTPTGCFGDYRP